VCHDVAPVARGIADTKKNWLILASSALQGFLAPGVPVYGIVRVLLQIRGGFVDQVVRLPIAVVAMVMLAQLGLLWAMLRVCEVPPGA
jgi:hypothetical protein